MGLSPLPPKINLASQLTDILALKSKSCCLRSLWSVSRGVALLRRNRRRNDSPRDEFICCARLRKDDWFDSPSLNVTSIVVLAVAPCESVCPAGVEYGQLLEAGRSELLNSNVGEVLAIVCCAWFCDTFGCSRSRLRLAFACSRVLRKYGFAALTDQVEAGPPDLTEVLNLGWRCGEFSGSRH